ncbi:MAG: hypothetical protein WCG93_06425 [Paludibacter sp.]
MKKLLFTALFSALFVGSAFAQFSINTNAAIGQISKSVVSTDKDTFTVNFNTNVLNSTWLKSKKSPYTADSVVVRKCQTQKGLQAIIYSDATLTTSMQSANFKCVSYTGNGNPVHVFSVDSLLKVMTKSAATTYNTGTTVISTTSPTNNGNPGDSLTLPAHCLFDVAGSATNQAYGVYPGKYKHVEYGFYYNLVGKTCTDDITFDMDTYSAGTTGKTASYELTVYANTSTITSFSAIGTTTADTYLMGRIANFYTTGSGPVSINLSTLLGKTAGDFTNKYVYIFLKTLGTSNASSVVDGLPNAANYVTHTPIAYDPIITFDNFNLMYSIPQWTLPTGVVANSYLNHNNGTVSVGSATDLTGGTPVAVAAGVESKIKIYLSDIKRASTLTITEGNDGGGTNTKYSFAATGAVKAKSGSLGYVTDVPYTFTPTDGTTKFTLTIPAPTAGTLANDTLEVSISVNNLAANVTSPERLEINNGVRFYYTLSAIASLTALQNPNAQSAIIYSANNSIFATNATENLVIYNVAGQKLRTLTPAQAARGEAMQQGLYIVKSGANIQKVLVK